MDRRISQFDGLRAFAFMAVFLRHAIKLPLGWVGVDVFFVLSGFLITRNLLGLRASENPRRSFAVFYFRRVLRIIPPYYLALLVMLAVQPITGKDAAWYFAFGSNIRDSFVGQIIGVYAPMWSIAVEEQFYLLWPWIVLLLPERRLPVLFLGVILAAPLVRYLMTPYGFDAIYTLMPCRMDLLAAGALFAIVDQRAPMFFKRMRHVFVVGMIVAVATIAIVSRVDHHFRTNLGYPLFNVLGFELTGLFAVSVFAYVRGLDDGIAMRVLLHPALQYIGMISYMCYLIHLVLLKLLEHAHLGVPVTAVLGFAGTIGFATLSWYFVEKPLQRLRGLVRPLQA